MAARDAANNTSAASAGVSATTSAGSGGSGSSALAVTYQVGSDWGSGFTATVTVTNRGTAAVSAWQVAWTWAGNQKVTNAWNGTVTQSGTAVTAAPVGWNSALPVGGSASFGFQGTYTGTNSAPTPTVTGS